MIMYFHFLTLVEVGLKLVFPVPTQGFQFIHVLGFLSSLWWMRMEMEVMDPFPLLLSLHFLGFKPNDSSSGLA